MCIYSQVYQGIFLPSSYYIGFNYHYSILKSVTTWAKLRQFDLTFSLKVVYTLKGFWKRGETYSLKRLYNFPGNKLDGLSN